MTTALWEDTNGRVACTAHLGCHATLLLDVAPRTRVIETDLTKWTRLSKAEVADWTAYITANTGQTEACETCRYAAKHNNNTEQETK